MPDKPFSVLLHIATSLESSLFITISNTIYIWLGIFSLSLSLFSPSLYIYLKTQSAIHIHSHMFCMCSIFLYYTSYNFNFTFSHQRKTKASTKCVLFLSHFLSNGLILMRSLSLFFSFHYPLFLATLVEMLCVS